MHKYYLYTCHNTHVKQRSPLANCHHSLTWQYSQEYSWYPQEYRTESSNQTETLTWAVIIQSSLPPCSTRYLVTAKFPSWQAIMRQDQPSCKCMASTAATLLLCESVIIVFITLQNQSAPSQMTIIVWRQESTLFWSRLKIEHGHEGCCQISRKFAAKQAYWVCQHQQVRASTLAKVFNHFKVWTGACYVQASHSPLQTHVNWCLSTLDTRSP